MKGLSFSVAIIQYPNVITMSSKIINLAKPLHSLLPLAGEKYFPPPSRGRLEGGWGFAGAV